MHHRLTGLFVAGLVCFACGPDDDDPDDGTKGTGGHSGGRGDTVSGGAATGGTPRGGRGGSHSGAGGTDAGGGVGVGGGPSSGGDTGGIGGDGFAGSDGGADGSGGGWVAEDPFTRVQRTASCFTKYDSPDDGVVVGPNGDSKLTNANAVFVVGSADGGNDANDGTREHPKATLAAAATLARANNKALAVAAGSYQPTDLRKLFVYGGYHAGDWLRNPALYETRIVADGTLLIGGDMETLTSGGVDGLTIAGSVASGALVQDVTTGDESQPLYGSSVVNSIVDCSNCSGAVIALNNPKVFVGGTRVRGGRIGIKAASPGGLGRFTDTKICGNDVAGGSDYDAAIDVGDYAQGPVSVEWNDVAIDSSSSVGVRVGAQYLPSVPDLPEAGLVANNLVVGRGSVGVWMAAGGVFASNLIQLANGGSKGIVAAAVPLPANWGKSPAVTLLGNAISVRGTALSIERVSINGLWTSTPAERYGRVAVLNNSLRATTGVWLYSAWAGEFYAVNNIVEASATALDLVFREDVLPPEEQPLYFEATLKNNDLLGKACAVATTVGGAQSQFCESSPAEVDACDWVGCKSATGTRRVSPGYVSESALRLATDSPCIDVGTDPAGFSLGHAALLATDPNGDARPKGAAWDIGYDEF